MRNMKRVLSLLLLQFLFFGLAVSAQTVSPIIVECGMKCRGEFSITNNGLTALAVTVEARSFSLDSLGHATNRPLDAGVDLKLEEGSARISPKGTHTFGYQLKCSAPSCSVALLSSMVVGHTAEGMLVRVQLAHTVYSCEKQRDCRKKVRAAAGIRDD
jgi:uncharacterized protein (UPF0212 family)